MDKSALFAPASRRLNARSGAIQFQRMGLVVAVWLVAATAMPADPIDRIARHTGIKDASAGIAISRELFVAGDDEENVLNVYRRDQSGPPLASFNLDDFIKPDHRHPEMDIEGATKITDADHRDIYFWITSHGCNANGKRRSSRQALFATRFHGVNDKATGDKASDDNASGKNLAIEFVGKPCKGLLDALLADRRYRALRLEDASHLPPKAMGGLNIEGLAATPTGHLLVGFRNPTYEGKAIVATIRNPLDAIAGKAIELGDPLLIDLGGLGIRSFEYWPERKEYLIAAGPRGKGECRLFTWLGPPHAEPKAVEGMSFKKFSPEALIVYRDSDVQGIQLLSDDGRTSGNTVGGNGPSFRSGWIKFDDNQENERR